MAKIHFHEFDSLLFVCYFSAKDSHIFFLCKFFLVTDKNKMPYLVEFHNNPVSVVFSYKTAF